MAVNASFSPTAGATASHSVMQLDTTGFLSAILNRLDGWTLAFTLILGMVVYDQCKWFASRLRRRKHG
jgi:C-22 sterol desaturase